MYCTKKKEKSNKFLIFLLYNLYFTKIYTQVLHLNFLSNYILQYSIESTYITKNGKIDLEYILVGDLQGIVI